MMKILVLLLIATLNVHYAFSAMSEAQMKATLKLVRNVCQPKFKATDAEIEGMHTGNWKLEKSGKCYLWCILNMHKLISKENVFEWETGIATISAQAPESIRIHAVPALESCKDSVKTTTEKCEAAYEIAHCIYDANPEKYFLP